MGRPTTYTKRRGNKVCERVAAGESVRSICLDSLMPSRTTVFRWINADEQFRDQYARAKQFMIDCMEDDMLDIVDDGSNDFIERLNKKTGETELAFNGEHVQRSKLRYEARKWKLSKLRPKKYGDTLQLTTDPDKPFVIRSLNDFYGGVAEPVKGGESDGK